MVATILTRVIPACNKEDLLRFETTLHDVFSAVALNRVPYEAFNMDNGIKRVGIQKAPDLNIGESSVNNLAASKSSRDSAMNSNILQDGRGQKNPYSIKERFLRMAWSSAYWLLFFPVPRIFPAWHRLLLKCFGAKIGEGVIVFPTVRVIHPWMLEIGANTIVGDGVRLYSVGKIRIGKHTSISQRVHVCAGTHDYSDPRLPLIRSSVVIGNGCWICTEAFIGPGVTIGDRSVVGARSVVVKDLPPGMVCAGTPCRPIKPREMREVQ